MDNSEVLEIEGLAGELHNKRTRLRMMEMMNVFGLSAEEARARSIATELARTDALIAKNRLDSAQARIAALAA